jgi:hydroxyacylglutathione hydrolase
MEVVVIEVPELGNRTHLVHDGTHAMVVDPPRDVRPVELAAEEAGVRIATVADTHVHNDYVSGAPALARRHGADYLLSADERVSLDRTGVRGGDILGVGELVVQVLSTPGHTLHHQSFLVTDPESGQRTVFSGGSLLHGTVGRTDLVDPLLSRMMGRAQWESARQLGAFDDEVGLHPTHGFGSLCAATAPADSVHGTIGDERGSNPVLWTPRDRWVEALVAGFGPVPRHYRHMGALNRAGAGALPVPAPAAISEDEVHDAVRAGSWVLDLRERHAFARGHLTGSVNIEDCPQLATYAGWLVPWGADLVLVSDSPDDLEAGVHDLAQIGVEVRATHLLGPADRWTDSTDYRVADWTTYARSARGATLDVRLDAEHRAAHLPGSLHVPLHDLEAAIPRLPAGQVWVHCRSGFRAAIAASLLARRGRDVVLVSDDWAAVGALGLVTEASRPAA